MGRTPEAWARRYAGRKVAMQKIAETLGGKLQTNSAGGPGVPGNCPNEFWVELPSGEVLSRRQATRLALGSISE